MVAAAVAAAVALRCSGSLLARGRTSQPQAEAVAVEGKRAVRTALFLLATNSSMMAGLARGTIGTQGDTAAQPLAAWLTTGKARGSWGLAA